VSFQIHAVLILVYVLTSETTYISSATVFVTYSVITVLRYPLTALPTLLNQHVQVTFNDDT